MGGPEAAEPDPGSEHWAGSTQDEGVAMRWQRRADFLGQSPHWTEAGHESTKDSVPKTSPKNCFALLPT